MVWVSLVLVLFLFFWDQHFLNQIFWEQKLFGIKIFVGTNSFRDQNFGDQFYYGTKLYFLAQLLIRPSSRLTVSAWVSPSSTPACIYFSGHFSPWSTYLKYEPEKWFFDFFQTICFWKAESLCFKNLLEFLGSEVIWGRERSSKVKLEK